MIGDRGIPARYSGFSTLVEEVSTRLVADLGMDVTVYCRKQYFDAHPPSYKGVNLVYLNAPGGKSFESLLHSARAILHASLRRYDFVFIVDPGNGPLTLPLVLARKPFAIHTDGLGWQRSKWSPLQQRYYRWSEWVSARLANWLVTDSRAMQQYYVDSYDARSTFIPYGSHVGELPDAAAAAHLGLSPDGFHLVVARLEPENNVDYIIEQYRRSNARLPLIYVGGAMYESEHSRRVMAQSDDRVRCVGPVYDAAALNWLYASSRTYLHGHEVGGTNPSLLRAMDSGAACVPIDVVFHREVIGDEGIYFDKSRGDLAGLIERLEDDDAEVERLGRLARHRADTAYRWDAVAAGYAEMMTYLVDALRDGTRRRLLDPGETYRPAEFLQATDD